MIQPRSGTAAYANGTDVEGTGGRLFRLGLPSKDGMIRNLAALARGPVERLLGLEGLDGVYRRAAQTRDRRAFLDEALKALGVSHNLCDPELERIPRKGPVVVVANHPFGAIEGVVLAHALTQVLPDVRIMANYLLGRIPEMRELFVFVDPFGGEGAAGHNLGGLRQCVEHLRQGGLLAMFPAGEVSSLDLRRREVTDKPWTPMAGRLARRAGASVVPVFFNGRNGAVFQVAGLLHPSLRTALLPRELLNKGGRTLDVRVGGVIPARKLKEFQTDEGLTDYLRQRTYMLRHRGAGEVAVAAGTMNGGKVMRPVVQIGDVSALAAEIEALPAGQKLVEQDDLQVVIGSAEQMPAVLRELGRLREITFRAAGEGSGKSIDLDQFDSHYLHLTVWNRAKREVVGAYRLGRSDRILAERGIGRLYTYELFDYRRELLDRMGPALEMGRSFVRAEYQRSFSPLLLLWKGIGRFLIEHPEYRYLFGPVSISGAYQSASVRLMVQFLQMHHGDAEGQRLVSARSPFVAPAVPGWDDRRFSTLVRDEDDLSDLVGDLEIDQKGVPVLIRQYIRLGAKSLSFNVDRSFGDCVDGLILVDLLRTDTKVLSRYMGKEGVARLHERHSAAKSAGTAAGA